MKRRDVVRTTLGGAALGAAASAFPAPAIAQGRMEWRMITTWPKNFPGLGTGAELLARFITEGSDGRLTVRVHGAGEIVPPFESIDAVSGGTVEMGHGASYYWKGKVAATQFFTSVPFGLTAQEMNAWFHYGGGQELGDRVYAEMNCKYFPSGNTGVQMGGWFNREINSLDDLRGLKFRIPGLPAEIYTAAGATVLNLPGGEILPALQSGALDGADWVGPYNDLAFGLYRAARYYYWPGWQEPCGSLDCFVNLQAWESLPADLKSLVTTANEAVNLLVLSEFEARNNASLRTLLEEHRVELRRFPDEVLIGFGNLAGEIIDQQASLDPLSREVVDSQLRFREDSLGWSRLSEEALRQARALPYDYAQPG
jgi:TRAP-type mannitol/chloroaromatic compound transport system substrate-binding protein